MLKIKDNVDLKELENFGFEKTDNQYERICYDTELDADVIRIKEDRIIRNWTCLEGYDDSFVGEHKLEDYEKNKIDDLIKADMVEKVEE